MRNLGKRIESFQLVLNSFRSKDTLVTVFEDYKLEISTTHPAKSLGLKSCHGNQTSKPTDYVILLQRNEISNGEHVHKDSSVNGNNSTLDDTQSTQDTLGGPNMSDFDAEDRCVVTNLKPVSMDQARSVMCLFTQCLRKSAVEMPLCIVCDGTDSESTSLIEACPVVKDSCVNSVIVTTYSSSGPMHTKSELMRMDQLITKASSISNNQCSTFGYAEYDIMGKFYQDISMAVNLQQGQTSVKLDCTWEDVKNVLETPHGAKCTVHIKAVPGSLNSAAHGVYTELSVLAGFAAGLSTGEIQWTSAVTSSSSSTSVEKLLAELIETVKQGEQKKVLVEDSSGENSPLMKPKIIRERDDLDFTERLWILLKDHARCYNDIVISMKNVLGELHSGQLQPMVHSSNCTSMAKHIRASYQNKMTLNPKDVDGLEPLRMLVEIGVDKLKRDYLTSFISQELATLDRLQWYLTPANISDLSLEELVRRLQDLHCVLELYVVGSTSLSLPHKTLWALVRCGLKYYENPEQTKDDDHTFSIQVDRSAMLRFYSSFQPSVWQVEVKCGSSDVDMKRAVYQLSVNRPFDHVTYDSEINTTNALDQTGAEGDQFTMYETMATTSQIALLS